MSDGAGGSDQQGYTGQLGLTSSNSEGNRHRFQAEQIMGEKRTHFVAKIVKVYNRNSLTDPCTVDIQPVVKLMDGSGKSASHGTIYGVPVPRNQSGDSVVVNDPQMGDVANFSVLDRDHSSSQSNDWKEANPGSFRRSTLSDAVFHSVMPRKGQAVKQHILFDENGVAITQRDGHTIKMTKDGINLNGVIIDKDGNLTSPKNITAGKGGADQVSLQGHTHASGPAPTPGT